MTCHLIGYVYMYVEMNHYIFILDTICILIESLESRKVSTEKRVVLRYFSIFSLVESKKQ